MIKRAPRPKQNFLILHNETADDPRLTFRASGVLTSILAKPDNWTATAEHLAASRPNGEGVKAIRKALKELEAAGYLKRERVRGPDGRFSWVQTVYDVPITDTSAEETDVSAGQTISPKPPGGFPPGGNRPSKQELRTRTQNNEKKRPDSGRSAPSVGTSEDDQDPPTVSTPNPDDEPPHIAAWRAEDRATFKNILGDWIQSNGYKDWKRGLFTTDALYDALRAGSPKRKPINWPGMYLSRVIEGPTPAGLVNWLDDHGFELVDPDMAMLV